MKRNHRILKEINSLMKDNDLDKNQYCIEVMADSTSHIIGKIRGAPDTPFEGGIFTIDIIFPERYPFVAPICRFVTSIWHPNISSVTGVICLDILKDQWAASITTGAVLLSLQNLMVNPEPRDPQDAIVAAQYTQHPDLYIKTAKYWTYWYAIDPQRRQTFNTNEFKDFELKIAAYGQTRKQETTDQALTKLSNSHWDLDKALQR